MPPVHRRHKLAFALAALFFNPPVFATNGVNMEGYGPLAAAMGGAGMAYDNGNAATMNNPATLALAQQGIRIDLALGRLGPSVKSNNAASDGKAYYMPAFGISYRRNDWIFGLGVFAQGGMGTEYADSFVSGHLQSMLGSPVSDPGFANRSEVCVGRAILPLAWQASDRLTLGVSLDYVWANMDLKMLIDGRHFADLLNGNGTFGSAGGSMIQGFQGAMGAGLINDVQWGYFNFSDNNKFTGAAKATGYAGKIGATYKLNDKLTLGFSYHSQTSLNDMQAENAQMIMRTDISAAGATAWGLPGAGSYDLPLSGKLRVINFQWPELYGFGFAYQADDRWLLVGDYRRIGWKKVMEHFQMQFQVSPAASNAAFAGANLDMSMRQDWRDQNVFMFGAAYRYDSALTLRGGVNLANTPVPDATVNPLFPAIVRNHLTLGAGYTFPGSGSLNFSLSYGPRVKLTNNYGYLPGSENATISHRQINAQLMYSWYL